MVRALTPIETFLQPLAELAANDQAIEGYVIWHHNGGWADVDGEPLDSEEICFYAEGLLLEGFHMLWEILGTAGAPPEAIRMFFWQGSIAPPPPGPNTLSRGQWPPS